MLNISQFSRAYFFFKHQAFPMDYCNYTTFGYLLRFEKKIPVQCLEGGWTGFEVFPWPILDILTFVLLHFVPRAPAAWNPAW